MPPKVRKPTKNSTRPTSAKDEELENQIEVSDLNIEKPTPKKPAEFPTDPKNSNVRYWLIKSEPLSRIDPKTGIDAKFSFRDLQEEEFEQWDGVRNYEARNNMLNMSKGDVLLFYHSNAPVPGIVGLAKVYNEAHPDSSQFDTKTNYYDPKSTKENPRWWCVDVSFVRKFRAKVSLEEVRRDEKLQEMALIKRSRLSVTPVRKEEYYEILEIEKSKKITDDIDCELDHKYIDAK